MKNIQITSGGGGVDSHCRWSARWIITYHRLSQKKHCRWRNVFDDM